LGALPLPQETTKIEQQEQVMDKQKTFSKIATPKGEEVAMRGRQRRKVGNRSLVKRVDEVELGVDGVWTLVKVEGWCQSGWTSMKLFRDEVGPKNLWQVGFKDGRLARNKDAGLLGEHHPEVVVWVKETVAKHLGDQNGQA
jgi:hypothetical protein